MVNRYGNLKRKVSIIGQGMTKFGCVRESPEIKDMTMRELWACATHEAMEDAHVEPKDIDAFYVGNLMSELTEKASHISPTLADWCGLAYKPGTSIDAACASSHVALREAIFAVASGHFDIVLAGGVEIGTSYVGADYPAAATPIPGREFWEMTFTVYDRAYLYHHLVDSSFLAMPVIAYSKKYGVDIDKMCDALDACTISLHRNAARNPKARFNWEIDDEARKKGFNDVHEYLRSDEHDPYVSWPTRRKHWQGNADGATALIVCDSRIAKKFQDTPIDVVGMGLSVGGGIDEDMLEWRVDKEAIGQAMGMAKIKGKDLDYLETHDCCVINSIKISEMIGYIEKGEAWKAAVEGRMAFDGDKPINTDGGRPVLGHPYGATGAAMIIECVKQMRGMADKRQIKPAPETSLIHNYGSGLSVAVSVLKTR